MRTSSWDRGNGIVWVHEGVAREAPHRVVVWNSVALRFFRTRASAKVYAARPDVERRGDLVALAQAGDGRAIGYAWHDEGELLGRDRLTMPAAALLATGEWVLHPLS